MLAIEVRTAYIQANYSYIMKKAITITLTALSAILILDSMNFGYALAMFYLAGIVPGTNLVIDADRMLSLFVILLGFVLARISIYLFKRYNTLRPQL